MVRADNVAIKRVASGSLMALWLLEQGKRLVKLYLGALGTYMHEVCHGVASLCSGGVFERFAVFPDNGGAAWTRGGHRMTILCAGYVGTPLVGGVLVMAATTTTSAMAACAVAGLCMLFSALKSADRRTACLGVATGVVLGVVWATGSEVCRAVCGVMGSGLIVEGFRALKHLVWLTATDRKVGTDAEVLGQMTGLGAGVWTAGLTAAGVLAALATVALAVLIMRST